MANIPDEPSERDRLAAAFKRLLWEANERKVREIISRDLGQPDGTPAHDHLLKCWRECREREGWKVS